MGLNKETAEEYEFYQERRRAMQQAFDLTIQVMKHNRDEILAFGEYAKMVHPEDLPIDYKSGMKLVSWEQMNGLQKKLNYIYKLLTSPVVSKGEAFTHIMRMTEPENELDKENTFAAD